MNHMPNILIVDDEEVVRRSFSRVLDGAHCRTESVVDGEQALQALARERFDVVLLDQRMPGTDGITVLKTIKARWPDSEVVMITGYPNVEAAKEAVRLGAFLRDFFGIYGAAQIQDRKSNNSQDQQLLIHNLASPPFLWFPFSPYPSF